MFLSIHHFRDGFFVDPKQFLFVFCEHYVFITHYGQTRSALKARAVSSFNESTVLFSRNVGSLLELVEKENDCNAHYIHIMFCTIFLGF